MKKEAQLWYIKRKGQIKGPFPTGLMSQNILLGRIHPDDQISLDKQLWKKASSVKEVMPDVIKHRDDPNYKERLKAARRWADERQHVRQVGANGKERIFKVRKKMTHLGIKTLSPLGIISVSLVLMMFVGIFFVFTPEQSSTEIDCQARATDNGIYDSCHLQRKIFNQVSLKNSSFKNALLQNSQFKGADLRQSQLDYANLSMADLSLANMSQSSLKAVDLRGANLYRADLSHTDLSYADLTGANGKEVKLTGAILKNTIWFNGQICNKASVGRCKK